ncbi:MAG: KEOPS complex subunit Pcc1 [archaeon GB-1867-097]|nr:KEOPS complex subunit Pcc1 [Candidatus Culexmicrobium thermophilum]MCS7384159.1 KEOPS complex subunit Pcc1 [Candidatus Culexmicrobium thermophilum]
MFRAEVKVDLEDSGLAFAVYRSLIPEAVDPPSNKVKVAVSLESTILKFYFSTDSLSSLRAAINSYLRWVMVAVESLRKPFK